jgi:hypothetical protein
VREAVREALDRIDPGWAAAPVPASVAHSVAGLVQLAGTTWEGEETPGGRYEYTFHPDGTLEYDYSTGRFRNGTWRQDGDSVYMEMNGQYAENKGTIRGQRMEGSGSNVNGLRWTWWATLRGGTATAPVPPSDGAAAAQALVGEWHEYWDGEPNPDPVRISADAGGGVRLARGGSGDRYSDVSFDGQVLTYRERDLDGETYEVTLELETPDRLAGPIVSDRRGVHRRELRRER